MKKVCLSCGHTDAKLWATALDQEYFTTEDQFDYLRCGACRALFIDPVPRDRLQQIYPANYYSFSEGVTKSFTFRVKDWLDQRFYRKFVSGLPAKTIDVLDVGGGAGWQLDSFRKIDQRVQRTAIVDLDKEAAQTARALGHDYFCGRFEEYRSEKLFDVILMLNLIEHVDNPRQLLERAADLLSPDGIVILKTPNTDSLDARLFRQANWGGYHCPRHWVLFDQENLTSLIHSAGLRVKYFKYTQGAPFWTASILSALGRKGWLRIDRDNPLPNHPLFPLINMAFACVDLTRGTLAKTSQMFFVLEKSP